MKLLLNILLLSIIFTSCAQKELKLQDVTVKITNLEQNSGGSGSIVFAGSQYALALTNAHVCEVVKNGGYVHLDTAEKFSVISYRQSEEHDLCIIKVLAVLRKAATIAEKAPPIYSSSHVSGHPHLLPTIINKGHFSGRQLIKVAVGVKDCTEQDLSNPDTALICALVGKLPIIKTFDSQVLSNTIQPGSSGSGVFNEKGEISGVVFAGSGDLSYAMIVPFEYVQRFVVSEYKTLKDQMPNLTTSFNNHSVPRKNFIEEIYKVCYQKEEAVNTKVCKELKSTNLIEIF